MDRQFDKHMQRRKKRELEKRREKMMDQLPVRQLDVMPFWFLAAGATLVIAVLAIWFLAFS
jgi:hypothetical protein